MLKRLPTVLIVNDSAFTRDLQSELLREAGFEVLAPALNGEDGVARYLDERPTLVVMDTVMPFMHGVDATAELFAEDPNARVLISASSGQEQMVAAALESGAQNFVVWPCLRLEFKVLARQVAGLHVEQADVESVRSDTERLVAAKEAPKTHAIEISCRVDARDSSGQPSTSKALEWLDGRCIEDSPLSDFIWPADPLAFIGLEGGEPVLRWHPERSALRVTSTFLSPRALSGAERQLLLEYVRGQWADGAGENFASGFQTTEVLSISGEDLTTRSWRLDES